MRDVSEVRNELGAVDRRRMDRYLDNVREIERRIQLVERRNDGAAEPRELPDAPPGVPDSFSEHMQLMFDLQVLAMETDMTRVISFKTGRDAQTLAAAALRLGALAVALRDLRPRTQMICGVLALAMSVPSDLPASASEPNKSRQSS